MKTGISNILVVIPCYNEQDNILPLLAQLQHIEIAGCRIRPLVIDDASTDATREILRQNRVRFLENTVNLGIGGTVQLGFLYGMANGYDVVVQMDGDGQHPPSQLHKLLGPLLSDNADIVTGSRFIHQEGFKSTFMRRMGIRFFYVLNKWLTGVTVRDSTSGFRAFNRRAMELASVYYPDEYPEPEVILYMAHKKMRIAEVSVEMNERHAGVSSITSWRSVYYMMKVSLNIIFLHLKLKVHG